MDRNKFSPTENQLHPVHLVCAEGLYAPTRSSTAVGTYPGTAVLVPVPLHALVYLAELRAAAATTTAAVLLL